MNLQLKDATYYDRLAAQLDNRFAGNGAVRVIDPRTVRIVIPPDPVKPKLREAATVVKHGWDHRRQKPKRQYGSKNSQITQAVADEIIASICAQSPLGREALDIRKRTAEAIKVRGLIVEALQRRGANIPLVCSLTGFSRTAVGRALGWAHMQQPKRVYTRDRSKCDHEGQWMSDGGNRQRCKACGKTRKGEG